MVGCTNHLQYKLFYYRNDWYLLIKNCSIVIHKFHLNYYFFSGYVGCWWSTKTWNEWWWWGISISWFCRSPCLFRILPRSRKYLYFVTSCYIVFDARNCRKRDCVLGCILVSMFFRQKLWLNTIRLYYIDKSVKLHKPNHS